MARLQKSNGTPTAGWFTLGRVVLVAGAVIIGASTFMSWHSIATLNELEVGGPRYSQIAAGKDFIADILPPPLFPVEAYAIANLLSDNPELLATKKPVLDELRVQFDKRLKYWMTEAGDLRFLQGEVKQKFASSFGALGEKFWNEIDLTLLPAIERGDQAAMDAAVHRLAGQYGEFRALIDGALPDVFNNIASAESEAVAEANRKDTIGMFIAGFVVLLISALVYAMFPMIIYPILEVTGLLARLASGDISEDRPSAGGVKLERRKRKRVDANRGDEIGQLARVAVAFKQNSLDALRLSRQQEEARQRAVEEGHRLQEEAIARERATVSESIGEGLNRLAAKDLTYRVSNMPDAYRKLETDFNSALDQLEEAIQMVSGNTDTINSGTQEISAASDDLSKRTETQAASIEETAAAVAEITQTVKQTASGAQQAREVVASAREEATKSSEVVRRAIDAMGGIEKSSQQITQIIGVIDEIAFQTNLLALNAGVEAARAGDAGRGFAVVASEVRALAQRSAEAAKEIKALLQTSRNQVEQGVKLVGETGTSLERIVERVAQVNTVVAEIAASAQSQAAGLQQVNTAVGQMDQTTQQNAAMVEQSTAASRTLAGQSQEMAHVVASFTTRALRAIAPQRREAQHRPAPQAPREQRKPAPKLRVAGGGAAAESWEEF